MDQQPQRGERDDDRPDRELHLPDWPDPDWRLIAESIPHMVWVADPDGRVLYVNQLGMDYLGDPTPELHWWDMLHPDHVDGAVAAWSQAIRERTTLHQDVFARRADGTHRWLAIRSQPILDADDQITRWIGTATDIDDGRHLQERLVDSQREASEAVHLLATLQDAAPVGIGFVDRQLRIVRMNQELARYSALELDDQIGRTVAEVVPELWDQLQPIYAHVLGTGEAVRNLPVSVTQGRGPGRRELLCNYYPVGIDDEIAGVGVVVVDVTERIQADGFRLTVMNQIADGVYTQDREGRLTYMNRAASRMLGWTEAELCGRHMHEVVHFQRIDGTPVGASECALLQEGTEHRLTQVDDEAFTRKDGSVFPVAFSSVPLRVGDRVDGVSVVFRDISDPTRSTNTIRVLIADPDAASSAAIVTMLTRHEGLEVVSVTTTSAATVEQARSSRPDVVLIDAGLPHIGGTATARLVSSGAPDASIILLAVGHDEAVTAGAIAAGCAGVVDKQRAWVDLANAVRGAYHGETTISQAELQRVVTKVRDTWHPARAQRLTAREREVLGCVMQGLSNQLIADRLQVTVNTVRNHVQRILYKLDAHSKLEAVVVATREGLLEQVS